LATGCDGSGNADEGGAVGDDGDADRALLSVIRALDTSEQPGLSDLADKLEAKMFERVVASRIALYQISAVTSITPTSIKNLAPEFPGSRIVRQLAPLGAGKAYTGDYGALVG
jgi:hypothetical protein